MSRSCTSVLSEPLSPEVERMGGMSEGSGGVGSYGVGSGVNVTDSFE